MIDVKAEIIKAWDASQLCSEELRMIEELDILDDQEMVEMYRKALKGKEDRKSESRPQQQILKLSSDAEEYLKKYPELTSATDAFKPDNLQLFCELLKANAIATTALDLERDDKIYDK